MPLAWFPARVGSEVNKFLMSRCLGLSQRRTLSSSSVASETKMIGSECERRKIGARTLINFNWMRRVGNCSSSRCMQSMLAFIHFVQLETVNFSFPLHVKSVQSTKGWKFIVGPERAQHKLIETDLCNACRRRRKFSRSGAGNVVGDKLRVEVDWRLRDAIWMKFEWATCWRCNCTESSPLSSTLLVNW